MLLFRNGCVVVVAASHAGTLTMPARPSLKRPAWPLSVFLSPQLMTTGEERIQRENLNHTWTTKRSSTVTHGNVTSSIHVSGRIVNPSAWFRQFRQRHSSKTEKISNLNSPHPFANPPSPPYPLQENAHLTSHLPVCVGAEVVFRPHAESSFIQAHFSPHNVSHL